MLSWLHSIKFVKYELVSKRETNKNVKNIYSIYMRLSFMEKEIMMVNARAHVCSNANPLHYYVLRVPRKVDRWR